MYAFQGSAQGKEGQAASRVPNCRPGPAPKAPIGLGASDADALPHLGGAQCAAAVQVGEGTLAYNTTLALQ